MRAHPRSAGCGARPHRQAGAGGWLYLCFEPAGLFGWVETGVDTDALTQRLLDEGFLIAPGSLFHARRPPSTLMRVNFATAQDAAFWKVFARVRSEL